MPAKLEHVNLTVRDARATAKVLETLFDWRVRWEGDSIHGGFSVHVGEDTTYIALYTPPKPPEEGPESYFQVNGLNHVAVTVDDLEATEARVRAAGFQPGEHHDYEPGRRFYFDDGDGVEYEVVSYA